MGRSVDTRSLQHYLGHKNIQHTVRYPKEVPPCLTGTVSKICWRFCTGTLQRRLMRSHSIAGALSMASCQWDSKSTVWATGVSFLPWWKVLAELKKFSMSTTTNTPTPRCVLCCPLNGHSLHPWEAEVIREAGAFADRVVLASNPAVQACRRMRLPADYLYVRRSAVA